MNSRHQSRKQRLIAAVQSAREQRTREETGSSDYTKDPTCLGNRCLRNTYVLANKLSDHGFEPTIICGGVADKPIGPDGIKRNELPTTISSCRDEGKIHYWVETELRTYTLDLAAEFPEGDPNRWHPFIARTVPPNYYYLEDGIDYTFEVIPP